MRIEGTDLSITPTRDDAFTISHERDSVALAVGVVDTEEFSSVLGIPDTDVIHRAGGENIGVVVWESYVIYSIRMSSVSHLSLELIGVDPVDVGLIGTSEEVGEVLGECQGADASPNLGPLLDLHGLDGDLGNSTISSPDKEVSIG